MSKRKTDATLYYDTVGRCPLCGSRHIRHRYHIIRYAPSFDIDRCSACGFMFMNPRFTGNVIKQLYGEGYYSGTSEYSYHDERQTETYSRQVWDRRIDVIRRSVASGNLLDVGSSFGGFLKAASRYYVPHGIEMSAYAGEYSQQTFGDRVHVGTLEDHPFGCGYFSVITMIELLEHLPDPVVALKECHRLLRDNGLLLIQTANMDGIQARILGGSYAYFMPGHLSYFTKKNLTMALALCGYRTIKVFYPVEFGLLPKLKKSRYAFASPWDYRTWLRIAAYHYISKIHFLNFAATSSMVIYAIK
ncbi:MAG: hypothetical protein A2176_08190 [Spirochaetes bacterium RBG_13_51_14]|nr:MAG: hypothetical protein A2176_08190 [Spirochaetes bacterium RBG_13_51_14]